MAVYFIQAGEGGPVKIGYAKDVVGRMRSIGGAKSGMSIIRSLPGGDLEEGYFHYRYAAQRIHSEWFTLVPAMLIDTPPALPARLVGHGSAPMSVAIGIQQFGGTKATALLFGLQPNSIEQWIDGEIPLRRQHHWYAAATERGIRLPNRIFWSRYHQRVAEPVPGEAA